jgi:hypothetical protein
LIRRKLLYKQFPDLRRKAMPFKFLVKALLILGAIGLSSSCKPRRSNSQAKGALVIGEDAKVFVFFRKDELVFARSCPDLVLDITIETLDQKCPVSGDNQKTFPVRYFGDRLKGAFFLESFRKVGEISPFTEFLQKKPEELEQFATTQANVLNRIKAIKEFKNKFPNSVGKYNAELTKLEAESKTNVKLASLIERFNKLVDPVINEILENPELVPFEAASEKDSLIANMLQSLYTEASDSDYSADKVKKTDLTQTQNSTLMTQSFFWRNSLYYLKHVLKQDSSTAELWTIDSSTQTHKFVSSLGTLNTMAIGQNGKVYFTVPSSKKYLGSKVYDLAAFDLMSGKTETVVTAEDDVKGPFSGYVYTVLQDGRLIYASRSKGANGAIGSGNEVWLFDPKTSLRTQITSGEDGHSDVDAYGACELPDGRIVVSSDKSQNRYYEMWAVDLTKKSWKKLTSWSEGRGKISSYVGAATADGKLFFTSDLAREGHLDLWVMDPNSMQKKLVSSGVFAAAGSKIAVNPSTGQLVVPSYSNSGSYHLKMITPNGTTGSAPTFNPGGTSPSSTTSGATTAPSAGAGGLYTDQDVKDAIATHKSTTWVAYNQDTSLVSSCLGNRPDPEWSVEMLNYYCSFPGDPGGNKYPNIRNCFTGAAKNCSDKIPGTKNTANPKNMTAVKKCYSDAYDTCSAPGQPLNDFRKGSEDGLFRAVMIDRQFYKNFPK